MSYIKTSLIVAFMGVMPLLLNGCAGETTAVSGNVCIPNATIECLCLNGDAGFQQCAPDGSGFVAPCDCSGGATSADAADSSDANDNGDGNDTATSDAADATDNSDSSDATNAVDTVDSADASDASDTSDATDTSDNTDGADISDGTSTTDSTDGSDQSDGSDTTDGTDAIDGIDAADGLNGTDAGTALDATDTSYVSGDGNAFSEPTDVPSCIKAFNDSTIATEGGRIHRSGYISNVTAPIREHLTGEPLSGIRFLPGTGCGLDTANGVWCWEDGPVQQSTDIWSSNTAFRVIDFDNEPLRATTGGSAQGNKSGGRTCVVREDTTIACWGNTGGGSTSDPNGHFPETPGCAFCAAYPTTVRTEGAQGEPLEGFTDVFVTAYSISAIDNEGALWAWGGNYFFRAYGDDQALPYHHPRKITGLPPISSVVAGEYGVCVLTAENGEVLCRAHQNESGGWVTLTDDTGAPIDAVKSITYTGQQPVVIHRENNEVWLTRFNNINLGGSAGTLEALTTYPLLPAQGANAFAAVRSHVASSNEIWAIDLQGNFHVIGSGAAPGSVQSGYPDFYDASQLPEVFESACLECVPSCGQADCGTDGCGGPCWNCAGDDYLCIDGLCVPPACTPSCPAGSCGPDGCGGTCGGCSEGDVCSDGMCIGAPCVADISSRYGLLKTGEVLRICNLTSSSCNSFPPVTVEDSDTPIDQVEALGHAYGYLSCGIRENAVWCWSAGYIIGAAFTKFESPTLQLTNTHVAHPIFLNEETPMTGVKSLSSALQSVCAILDEGELVCWGDTQQGTIVAPDTMTACSEGNFSCTPHPTPVLNSPGGDAVLDAKSVRMAEYHSCILRTDGTVWCWGTYGFGTGIAGWEDPNEDMFHPVQIEGFPMAAVSIHVANDELCAVLEDTTVWCLGESTYGMVGINSASTYETLHYPEPVRFGPFGEFVSTVKDVAITSYGKTFLLESGEVLALGSQGIAGSNAPQPTPGTIAFNSAPVDDGLKLRAANALNNRIIIRANGEVLGTANSSSSANLVNIGPQFEQFCTP
jgi:hypothetical protein